MIKKVWSRRFEVIVHLFLCRATAPNQTHVPYACLYRRDRRHDSVDLMGVIMANLTYAYIYQIMHAEEVITCGLPLDPTDVSFIAEDSTGKTQLFPKIRVSSQDPTNR